MIAYCGLICDNCPAYRATRSGDPADLETVLIHWRETFDIPYLNEADVVCDGCRAEGRLNSYCRLCAVRSCAQAQGVSNCAFCSDYPCAELKRLLTVCDRQRGFFGYARAARVNLERIREELG
jgi:hypothetical protein